MEKILKEPIIDDIKISFPTMYSKNTKKYSSEAGSQFLDQYDYKIEKNVKTLIKNGQTNIYDMIQAEADQVDINKLMLRFKNGETDVFDRVSGVYFDATEMPTTLADMYARVIDAENMFNSLSPDVKELFNNNPLEFFDQYGSDEFNSKIASLYPDDVVDTPVVSDESEVISNE